MKKTSFVLRRTVLALIASSVGASFSATAQQTTVASKASASSKVQPWPTTIIKLVVGFPAGSVQDISARILAEPLSKSLGQPVIVENKPGASGSIAAAYVAKATDGHTFGVMNNSQLTIAKILNPNAAYDPAKDLSPIALIATAPMVFVVSNTVAGTTPNQWILSLRDQGTKANYGTPGLGTPGHLGMEMIKAKSGIAMTHVPYAGNPQVITAMLSGQIQAALLPTGLALQQIKAGKMFAIGVTAEQRNVLAPDLPTLRESGIAGADIELFSAVAGPSSTPKFVQDKLGTAVVDAVKAAETRQRLITSGWQPAPSVAEGLRKKIIVENGRMGGIIIMRNIRAES